MAPPPPRTTKTRFQPSVAYPFPAEGWSFFLGAAAGSAASANIQQEVTSANITAAA
jgi:hypothetical protein